MIINDLLLKYPTKIKKNQLCDINHIITIDDVNKENICSKYNINSPNIFSNYGLYYENGIIMFLYNQLEKIEIIADKTQMNCKGGIVKLECFGVVNVINDNTVYKTLKQKIHPIYTVEGCEFNYIKNCAIINENYSFQKKEIKISAKYGYGGILYKTSLNITQDANTESEWILDNEKIIDIIAESSENNISHNGGETTITVKKKASLIFYKKDYFERVIDTKQTDNIITDITSDAIIMVNEPYKINCHNCVLFPPQKINAARRTATVICKYKEFTKQMEINQDKGAVITYKKIFEFDDGANNKVIKLDNCLARQIKLDLISYKIRLLNGVECDRIQDSNIIINNSNNWIDCKIDTDNMKLIITVLNNDTDSIRYGDIILKNGIYELILTISQESKIEIQCDYGITIECNDKLTDNDLKNYIIIYKPFKKIYYNDGSSDIIEYLEPGHKLDIIYNSSNENISFSPTKLCDFNGLHTAKIYLDDTNILNDDKIYINIKCRLLDNNLNQISDIFEKNIELDIIQPIIKNIEVTVTVVNESNYECAFSNDISHITIMDMNDNIILNQEVSRFWVSDEMKYDIVYINKVSLIEGQKYKFKIEQYSYSNSQTKFLCEEYLIENDDIGIDLYIKI